MIVSLTKFRVRLTFFAAASVYTCAVSLAQPKGNATEASAEFKQAEAAFHAQRYADAASRLELLKQRYPKSFAVNELLGLTYSAEGEKAKAAAQLQTAVALEPRDFDANYNLATLLLAEGKLANALPYLRTAHEVRPEDSSSSYNLALADLLTEDLKQARPLAEALLAKGESSEAHILLGRIDEQEGQFLPAANEFATAARLDPSEENLFVWGSEMLLHRTYEPAITIFRDGTKRYAQSPRLWVGLGMALYSRGEYVEAVHSLRRAAELDPKDPRCYLFLSKAYLSAPDQAQGVIEAFREYAALEPQNGRAQYYYAMALWKGRRVESAEVDYPAVETLLLKSIRLDGSFAESHLELGILYNDERTYEKSLPEYERALQLDPTLAEAHFRLGRYYLRTGEKEKAQAELDQFKSLQTAHQTEVDKERAQVQQFVVSATTAKPASPQ